MLTAEAHGGDRAEAARLDPAAPSGQDLAHLVAGIVQTHLHRHDTPPEQIPALIRQVGEALAPYAGIAAAASRPVPQATEATHDAPEPEPTRPDWMPEGTFGPQRPPSAPAVPIHQTHGYNYVVCLEDGRRMQMLKRHLKNVYGMTAEQYIAKWGLPEDYSLSCQAYREKRREIASSLGFQPNNRAAAGRGKRKAAASQTA